MFRKSFQVLIPVFIFAVLLLTGAAFGQQPSSQGISLEFMQQPWDATAGCPAAFTVEVISQGDFQGAVNLMVVDPPDKVNAVFYPNSVAVPLDGKVSTYMTVMVLPDTPQGMAELTVKGESVSAGEASATSILTFNVGPPCGKQPRTVMTTTVATTITLITTTTLGSITSISTTASTTSASTTPATLTETVADPSILVWAIGATVIAAVFAVVLLRRNRSS